MKQGPCDVNRIQQGCENKGCWVESLHGKQISFIQLDILSVTIAGMCSDKSVLFVP